MRQNAASASLSQSQMPERQLSSPRIALFSSCGTSGNKWPFWKMRAARESEELIECMNDEDIYGTPPVIQAIRHETEKLGFTMASEPKTGSLLRALAATKPGGRLLELGRGTGIGTAWLLAGMDGNSRLETVDRDPVV